jgi:hypothetical protein
MLIQPGFIRTNLGANRVGAALHLDVYASTRAKVGDRTARSIRDGTSPHAAAAAVEKLLVVPNPPLRTRVGADAHQLYFLRHVLPLRFQNGNAPTPELRGRLTGEQWPVQRRSWRGRLISSMPYGRRDRERSRRRDRARAGRSPSEGALRNGRYFRFMGSADCSVPDAR